MLPSVAKARCSRVFLCSGAALTVCSHGALRTAATDHRFTQLAFPSCRNKAAATRLTICRGAPLPTLAGNVYADCEGKSSVVEVFGVQDFRLTPCGAEEGDVEPHERWGRWRCRGGARGVPIYAYDCVADGVVAIAAHIISKMLEACLPDVVSRLQAAGAQRCSCTPYISSAWQTLSSIQACIYYGGPVWTGACCSL